jgi:hypothetical protein
VHARVGNMQVQRPPAKLQSAWPENLSFLSCPFFTRHCDVPGFHDLLALLKYGRARRSMRGNRRRTGVVCGEFVALDLCFFLPSRVWPWSPLDNIK